MMARTRTTAVLVVGMHRSGTSALAGVLGKLGIPLGGRLLEPGEDNPKGYWEHRDVVAVHERLLQAIGSRWDDVRALPSDWLSGEAGTRAAASLQDIITRDFFDQSVWAVKDPRLCRFLPLWLKVLGEMKITPVVLFIAREPAEVSASIEARNHWTSPLGEMLWLRNVTDAIVASTHLTREAILFDDLLSQPEEVARRALSRMGIAVPASPPKLAENAVASFVDQSIRHHRRNAKAAPGSGFAKIAHDLYEALVAVAHGAIGWADLGKNIEQFEAEWLRCGLGIDAVTDMAMKFAAEARESEIERYGVAAQLNAQVQWSEQAKQKHKSLQAENAELSSKLTAQIRWSREAQQRQEALQANYSQLSSKLTAQIRWSDEAQKRNEALQAENAKLSSELATQVESSELAVSKLDGLRVECTALQASKAVLSSKLAAQVELSELATSKLESLRAEFIALQAENAELSSKLAARVALSDQAASERESLRAEFVALSSTSSEQAHRLSVLEVELDGSESARRDLASQLRQAISDADRMRSDLGAQLQVSHDEREKLSNMLVSALQDKAAMADELCVVYASWPWRVTKFLNNVTGRLRRKVVRKTNDKRNAE